MAHLAGRDIYRKLGKKIDNLTMRAPWNQTFHAILKELYSEEEGEVVVKMPFGLSNLDQIEKTTRYERAKLQKILDSLCSKGLVMDLWLRGEYHYSPSPMIIGIFEFTMMRTRGELNMKEWAKLFHEYFDSENNFYWANFRHGEKISPLRALPHEGTVDPSEYVEVLDYEKATSIVEEAEKFSLGICSCRHEKLHVGEKKCDVPLETCSSFGAAADFMTRHGFAKEASKSEMLENLERSKEMGLIFCADNTKQGVSFICHCCGCCCNALLGVSKFGYPGMVVTSNFIAQSDEEVCTECGTCAQSCPINAIETAPQASPRIDASMCLGCAVCALKCPTQAMKLVKRKQRVLHPEDTFERVILQCLERGTLQNLMFNNPQSRTHAFVRGFVGGFLKLPPVKKALMSDMLRSSFLGMMKRGA